MKFTRSDALLILVTSVYFVLRLIKLEEYPLSFIADEAVHALRGVEFYQKGFEGSDGFMSLYFPNGQYWNLSASVYIQGAVAILFGKSVFWSRLTSVICSLLAMYSVLMICKVVLRQKLWWLGVLFLSAIPCWLFHSRTAMETVMGVGFYSAALLFYALYRSGSTGFLTACVVSATLSFYSYAAAQVWVVSLAGLLLLTDFRFHYDNRRKLALPIIALCVCALPFGFYFYSHSDRFSHQIKLLSSDPSSHTVTGSIVAFISRYFDTLDFSYLYFSEGELMRHRLFEFSSFGLWTLPFFFLGFVVCLCKIKDPIYRLIVLSLITIPLGGAIVGRGITRILALAVPYSVVCAISIEFLCTAINGRRFLRYAGTATTVGLLFVNAILFRGIYTLRPPPNVDWEFYGMQWGTREIFESAVPEMWRLYPNDRFYVTSEWANTVEFLVEFYDLSHLVTVRTLVGMMSNQEVLPENTIFVVTSWELTKLREGNKFKRLEILKEIDFPDGAPAFYFLRAAYVDNIDAVFDQEAIGLSAAVPEEVNFWGRHAKSLHSRVENSINNAFDGDPESNAKSVVPGPFVLEIDLDQPIPARELHFLTSTKIFNLKLLVWTEGQQSPIEISRSYHEDASKPEITVGITPNLIPIKKFRLELEEPNMGRRKSMVTHLWEVDLR